jgi:hypothetical protein
MAYLYDPPEKWATEDDCGDFPCTAPSNVLIDFKSTTYEGSTQPFTDSNFQIISDTDDVSKTFADCSFELKWNAWKCNN